jgi:hypothetical protein
VNINSGAETAAAISTPTATTSPTTTTTTTTTSPTTTSPLAPGTRSVLGHLAGWCYDHRRVVVIGWVAVVVAVIALATAAGSRFNDNFSAGNSQSQQAQNLLAQRFPA